MPWMLLLQHNCIQPGGQFLCLGSTLTFTACAIPRLQLPISILQHCCSGPSSTVLMLFATLRWWLHTTSLYYMDARLCLDTHMFVWLHQTAPCMQLSCTSYHLATCQHVTNLPGCTTPGDVQRHATPQPSHTFCLPHPSRGSAAPRYYRAAGVPLLPCVLYRAYLSRAAFPGEQTALRGFWGCSATSLIAHIPIINHSPETHARRSGICHPLCLTQLRRKLEAGAALEDCQPGARVSFHPHEHAT
jgi:hypothetical protein